MALIAIAMLWEPADWAMTLNDWRQGNFHLLDLAGLLPLVPSQVDNFGDALRGGENVGDALHFADRAGADEAAEGFGLGRKLEPDERIVIFESSQRSDTFKAWESGQRGGISAQSLDVAGTPEQAYSDAFKRSPKPGEPYWETTGGQVAEARRFGYRDAKGSPGHVGIYGGRWTPQKWFRRIWKKKRFK